CTSASPAGDAIFFSSRRRHTRFSRDWSSDVCSSDLTQRQRDTTLPQGTVDQQEEIVWLEGCGPVHRARLFSIGKVSQYTESAGKIGRASCRERVWVAAAAASARRTAGSRARRPRLAA